MNDHGFSEANKTLGEKSNDLQSHRVLQPYPDTCAIRSQELILEKYGYKTDHDNLVDKSIHLNIYERGHGTAPKHVGKLFDEYGVKYHQTINGHIFNIAHEIALGHSIIVGLNSDDLTQHGLYEAAELAESSGANHALVVVGLDFSDPEGPQVVVTDPGTGDVAKHYPMDQFIEAWKDADCFMVSTDEPPPPVLDLPEMHYFDERIGHLEKIGELPYETFSDVYEKLNDINFKRIAVWNHLCDTFSDVVAGNEQVEVLDQSVHAYIEAYHEAEHQIEETLSELPLTEADGIVPIEDPIEPNHDTGWYSPHKDSHDLDNDFEHRDSGDEEDIHDTYGDHSFDQPTKLS